MMQRCFMARSARVITRTAGTLAVLSPWVQTVPIMLVGVAAVGVLPGLTGADTDAVIPLLLAKYAPYVGAIVVAGAWAAGMSTLDSQLISASSLVTRDLYRYVRPDASDREQARVGQLFVLVVTVVMYFFVLTKPGFIVVLGTAGAGIAIAGYLFPTIGLLFWPRAGRVAALGGLVAGGLVAFLTFAVWRFPLGIHNTLWGLVIGGVVFLVLAYATAPLPYAQQARFHGLLADAIAGFRPPAAPPEVPVGARLQPEGGTRAA
jgi:SSS family solute:Na+ symporter